MITTIQTKGPFKLQQGQTVNFEQTTQSKRRNACIICWESFETKLDFIEHQERDHKDLKSFICIICDRSYQSYGNLRFHVKDKHSETYRFYTNTRESSPPTPRKVILHPCFICFISFKAKSDLSIHNNSKGHSFLKSVKCSLCNVTLGSLSNLRQHFHTFHLKEFNELTNKEQTTSENTINNDQEVNNTSTQDQQLRVARLPVQNEHSQPVTQGENPSTSELTVQDIAPLIEDLQKNPNFMYEAFKQVDDKKEAIEGMPSTSANPSNMHHTMLQEFSELTEQDIAPLIEDLQKNPNFMHEAFKQVADKKEAIGGMPSTSANPSNMHHTMLQEFSKLTEQDIAPLIEDLQKNPNFMYQAFKQVPDKKEAIGGMPSTSANTNMEQDFIDTRFNNDFTVQHNQNITRSKVKRTLYPCWPCLISFNTKYDLVRHNRDHHKNLKSFKCKLCDKIYDHYTSLRGHMQRKHAKEFKLFNGKTT